MPFYWKTVSWECLTYLELNEDVMKCFHFAVPLFLDMFSLVEVLSACMAVWSAKILLLLGLVISSLIDCSLCVCVCMLIPLVVVFTSRNERFWLTEDQVKKVWRLTSAMPWFTAKHFTVVAEWTHLWDCGTDFMQLFVFPKPEELSPI
jgi:hypothetical protein